MKVVPVVRRSKLRQNAELRDGFLLGVRRFSSQLPLS